MEEIYTIRVKCEPRPGLPYPSERAYSSSTVGGLAVAHLILALLSFTLSAPAYTIRASTVELAGGAGLVMGACLAGLAGLLASRRWYLDRHIRWFLFTSFFSMSTSLISAFITSFVIFTPPEFLFPPVYVINFSSTSINVSENTSSNHTEEVTVRKEIYCHMLLAAIFEFIVSLQSFRIAWTGVKNTATKRLNNQRDSMGVYNFENQNHIDAEKKVDAKLTNYSNVVKELCRLQKSALIGDGQIGKKIVSNLYSSNPELGNGLPLPESQKEYRERMERFLASHHAETKAAIIDENK